MTYLEDVRIDELRGAKDKLSSHLPSQDWLQPRGVTLHGDAIFIPSSEENTPVNALRLRRDPELKFVIKDPWIRRQPRDKHVRPTADLFERFLGLSSASDEQICDFASRFGPLLVYYRRERRSLHTEEDEIVVSESCRVWRYFADSMRAMLRIAANFRSGLTAKVADWKIIGNSPPRIAEYKDPFESGEYEVLDSLALSVAKAEAEWHSRARFIEQRAKLGSNLSMLEGLINNLVALGKVRPWLYWMKSESTRVPQISFSGPSLLSYLALQTCLKVANHDSFAVCSFCGNQYTPVGRAPKSGLQKHYCPDCRKRGVPVMMAQRARRERLRKQRAGVDASIKERDE
jgi:hypothetical protein